MNTKSHFSTTSPWTPLNTGRLSVLVPDVPLLFQMRINKNQNSLRIIAEIELILWMYWFGGLRVMAGRNLCRWLILKTPAIEVGELLAVILLIFLGIVMIGTHNIFRGLHLRSLWFWGPNQEQEYTVALPSWRSISAQITIIFYNLASNKVTNM